ncbi:uncharacterized protein LOC132742969 [Ruditapes philippinarum]|uniref:uncharacterized protein LOC132742969 n=1 Tax=Ruditapes philippinarum TaxID=129788 RepID=UPI00295C13BD|nr:uncharacterized protein LOC132742969 [Ruditapes philippinarum]
MAAIYLIFLCSFLISHETFGLDYQEYGRNKNSFLEKTEIEKYWKRIKLIKRSVENNIGENDANSDLVTTTSANSIYNYAPGSGNNNNISVKPMNSSANSGENQNDENSLPSPQIGDTSNQGNHNNDLNSQNSSNTSNQINDIDSMIISGNNTVNNNNNSTAISQSAISSSNHSSEYVREHALSTSQNETKNNTVDNFATPVTSTRQSASNAILSTTDKMANMLGGNNLNTSPPPTQVDNKMNNEIPEMSTQVSPLIQTTSAAQNIITTTPLTTIPMQNEIITESSVNFTTTVKTTIESNENNSNIFPTLASTASNETLKDLPQGNNETVYNSSNPANVVPENSPKPTLSAGTDKVTDTAVTAEPETNNETITNAPDFEPEPEPEPENNSTVVEPELTSEPEGSSNDTEIANPETTVQTVTSSIKQGLNSSSNQGSTDSPNVGITTQNTISNNSTDTESGPEPTGEPNNKLTNGTVEPEPSAKPELTDSPVTNSSTSEQSGNAEPTPETEETTTSSTIRTTTSKVEVDVTPEPESEATSEPEPENSTKSDNIGNTTTVSSNPSTLKPTTVVTTVEKVPETTIKLTTVEIVAETTIKPKTTTNPEPRPETSHEPVTSAHPEPSENVTTGSAIVEPTAEPEISSSTEKTHTGKNKQLVISICVLRATYLMVDAYNSLGTFPFGLDYFIYSTAFPCMTALFSILFYALLLATRVRAISKKVQKLWVLVLIVSLHFLLSIATDIVVGLFSSASVMIFICQAFFILWGLLMFVGYLVLFRKLYKGAMTHQKLMTGSPNEYKHNTSHTYQVKPTKQRYTLCLAVKITFISAFFGVAIIGFELYGMFGVYGVLKFETKPDPWPWWTYHTIVRSLEILMCLGVAYVASQPLRYKMKKDINHKIYDYLLPCSMCCCPNKLDQNEVFSSSISLDFVVSETDHLSWLKKIRNKSPSPKAPYPPHTAEKYSDPDATLLVRKIKRTSKPSMLVVEDGFVRIRREDENLPSNQYELDSRSSHSSDMNVGPDGQNTGALTNVVNLNYTGHSSPNVGHENVPGINFENYLLQGSASNQGYIDNDESADETDIDIVVTESEQESDNQDIPESAESGASNKSADIFRPLSMIDLAASMESELDRAFHSNCVEEADVISHNSLPPSFDRYDKNSSDCAFNESLCDKYCDNNAGGAVSNLDSTNYSSDSADDQGKSSDARLMRPLVRRCKSDDSKSSSPKYKHFEKNKYFSVSSVDTIGKDEEFTTHYGSNGEMRTEL